MNLGSDQLGLGVVGAENHGQEVSQVIGEIDAGEIFVFIQLLMNQRHGLDPILALPKNLLGLGIGDRSRLEIQETADDLQIIFNAVVNFLEHHLFLQEGSLNLFFVEFAFGDVD